MNRKKLIEVALPLEAINKASAREKSIRHGHPSTLHLWWARRPLAAARAVIFSQMVDDPSTYVNTLREDAKLRRKAETVLKSRLKTWEEAKALAAKAKGSGLQVQEPGPEPTLDDVLADQERQRLFRIIEDLVQWENTTNETVLQAAHDEIRQSWRRACVDNIDHPRAKELFDRNRLPAFHDPFAGGGALPLEAQRLGLESHASDLNPVAVLINKAMIEIPPKFSGRPPVNPRARSEIKRSGSWQAKGAAGLADDVRYYGEWMRDEAAKRIGKLYPPIEVTADMAKVRPDLKPYIGQKLTVIAWVWARSVKSPNPAFATVDVPLASTFMLSTKSGKEAYVEPVIEGSGYRFTVKVGKPKDAERAKNGTKLSRGANFKCLMSGAPIASEHIYSEANAGRMGTKLMAIVAEGQRGRVYLAPTREHEAAAGKAKPDWKPDLAMPENPRWFSPPLYGLKTYGDLFTPRQLVALTTFADLVSAAMQQARGDAVASGMVDDSTRLGEGGTGAAAYAEAVGVYLAFAVDRMAMTGNTLVRWNAVGEKAQHCFGRQALPMMWDFAEPNFLGNATGSIDAAVFYSSDPLNWMRPPVSGVSAQQDASTQDLSVDKLVSTDPPYYDNIGYADLADFFYVWLRRSLRATFPEFFGTLAVPKADELVATPYRHGSKEKAETFFLTGMTRAMHRLTQQSHPIFPVTIYYAFKQSESDGDEGTTNTGWDTFLAAVIEAGFAVSGTWPIRTEMRTRQIAMDTNALASSIVLVCRKRDATAPSATRREFVAALKSELPAALRHLQEGNIAPVDLAQAAIGPGMAVYTRYTNVLDAEGAPVAVREALALINQVLDETLAEQEGDFDADSRWALAWFEQHGFEAGPAGEAILLSTAKATALNGLEEAGIVTSGRGQVRLLKPSELPPEWDPTADSRLTHWETVHHLIRVLSDGGEGAAAKLVTVLGATADVARELCYRLYTLSERNKRSEEALMYNGLVQSWPEIIRLAGESRATEPTQVRLTEM